MPDAGQLGFARDGAELVRGAVDRAWLGLLTEGPGTGIPGSNQQPGRRSFTPTEPVRRLIAEAGPLGSLAATLCGRVCRAVRIIMFDKTSVTNWAVGWHQDRMIAVRQAADVEGFNCWTTKDGVCHVEPPEALLANMVTLRLHLDDCGQDNGALQILPGTHRLGRIDSVQAVRLGRQAIDAGNRSAVTCAAAAGDVLAMRLLTVHASARAANPSRRRVLHVDYSPDDLPAPLQWAI